MVKMIAARKFWYANKIIRAGETFEAENDEHALILFHAGHARREDAPDKTKRTYRRRDMQAES